MGEQYVLSLFLLHAPLYLQSFIPSLLDESTEGDMAALLTK